MTSSNQPHRIFGLTGRGLIIIGMAVVFVCLGIGDRQVLYDSPAVVDPEPALSAYLYPGGEAEGWVILQIGQGEGHAQIVFDPLFDTQQINRRYVAVP